MKRRAIVGWITLGVIAGFTGCNSLQGRREAELSDVSILNQHEQTKELELQVEWEDKLVYSMVHEVSPTENEEQVEVIRNEWPSEAGSFVIRARIEGDEEWEAREYPLEDREGSCYSIIIRIRTDGAIDIPSSTNEELC